MVVPPKRNLRGGLVGRERVSKRGSRVGLIRRLGRRRALLRRRLTAPPTGVRRACCSPAVYVAAPLRRRRVCASRQRESHWCDSPVRFRHARNPPRHPPRSRQCRSQRRAAERFEAPLDGVACVLTRPSVQLACQSRTCRPADTCAGVPREHGRAGPCSRSARSIRHERVRSSEMWGPPQDPSSSALSRARVVP